MHRLLLPSSRRSLASQSEIERGWQSRHAWRPGADTPPRQFLFPPFAQDPEKWPEILEKAFSSISVYLGLSRPHLSQLVPTRTTPPLAGHVSGVWAMRGGGKAVGYGHSLNDAEKKKFGKRDCACGKRVEIPLRSQHTSWRLESKNHENTANNLI